MSNEPKTISVPEAGRRYYGISRNASYEAVKRGEIPTIRVGRLLKVPIEAMERQLPLWDRDLARREAEHSGAGWDNLRASLIRSTRRKRQQSFFEATALFSAGFITGALLILILIMVGAR